MIKFKKHSSYSKLPILLVLFLLFTVTKINGQVIEYTDSWGPSGMTLTRETSSGVDINFSIDLLKLEDINIDGQPMKVPRLPNIFLFNEEGAPDLPGASKFIMIPQGAQVELKIISARTETISNINIAPAPRIPRDDDDSPLYYSKDQQIYSQNKFYPESPVTISEPTKVRGVDIVMFGITPFQYNPVTKELKIYRDLKVQVTFRGGNGKFGEDRLRSRWWDPILQGAIFNNSLLPRIDYSMRTLNSENGGCEYLIIRPTNPEFVQWADSIKKFRTLQGILTKVVSITDAGSNNAAALETYINNAYNTWTIPPSAVLLLGDYGTSTANNIISPNYSSSVISDNVLADVNGDHLPDIVFARMTANNSTEAKTLVTKCINYERTPPTNPNFYLKPITALGWQTSRWFQICSETVGGYWKNVHSKLPVRINAIYSGNPNTDPWSTATNTSTVLGVFGPTGLNYIPASPSALGGWTGGNATMVNNAINSGAFFLQHRDHGSVTSWGEPAYNNNNVNGLTNSDLVFINSINCSTGKFNTSGDCLVEKFHRHTSGGQNAGALGVIGASGTSYSFVNDTYVWGMMDYMWTDFLPSHPIYGYDTVSRGILPAFANVAGKYFLQQSSWPYNTNRKQITYYLFHLHGDAFMQLYSEVPQNLTVSHNPIIYTGATSFAVSANAGSFIALTLNGEILGTATGTGSPVNITIPGTQLPPDYIHVTVTKQNYYRYNADVQVVPPTGPYVIYDSVSISDPLPGGNNNGLMDYGETNKLNLTVKNVGVAQANGVNVKVTTTDSYITMTDSLESYGNIPAGQTKTMSQGFSYNVANNIPDGHLVPFTVTVTGTGEATWLSYFSIEAHAPVLERGTVVVLDTAGNNNGLIDPGETVDLKIKINNTGTSSAYNVIGQLSTTDTYITLNTDSLVYGNITGGGSADKSFSVTAASNTPYGHSANFGFDISANLGITASNPFNLVIGGSIPIPFVEKWLTTTFDTLYWSIYNNSIAIINASGVSTGTFPYPVPSPPYFLSVKGSTAQLVSKSFSLQGHDTIYLAMFESEHDLEIGESVYLEYKNSSGAWQLLHHFAGTNNGFGTFEPFDSVAYMLPSNALHSDFQFRYRGSGLESTDEWFFDNIWVTGDIVMNVTGTMTSTPTDFALDQNYPNPFNPVTKINFAIPKQGLVTLKVYDVTGREVVTLANEIMTPGFYTKEFNGQNFASGVYFYRLESSGFVQTKKMLLIK